jgi:transcriptional regulator with XRE-family HTH domain
MSLQVLPAQSRRTELASFLRACRARVTPEAAGLLPGLRRRTPGLRREEVAQLAGVGVTWYTWLEQGRRINASEQVLNAVARSLLLEDAERQHLFRLAEVTPTQVAVPAPPAGEVQKILDALDPLPASVVTSMYDIAGWNSAYAAMFPVVVESERRNSVWCSFATPDCCNPFVNRQEELPKLVAMMRAEYGKHVGEPAWEGFLTELRAASPHFTELWNRQQVSGPMRMQKLFRHAVFGDLRFTTTSLSIVTAPDCRILVYTPEDEETTARLEMIRAHPEAAKRDHGHPGWARRP